jgi:hypothetical protein
MKRIVLLALGGIVSFALTQSTFAGTTIFADDFETGNLSLWTVSSTTPNPLAIVTTQNAAPSGGQYSAYADLSADRMHRNIIGDNGGQEVSGASSFTAWIYDDTMTRAYVQALGYTGTGIPNGGTAADGTLGQLLAIGKYSSVTATGEVFDATKYQARITGGTFTGWFNLNDAGAPSRSAGWHKFTIEREADNTTIKFFVDDVLSRTVTGTTPQSWDTITMGFGTSSTSNGDSFYDGISVALIPEPSPFVLTLLGLGVLACWRRLRR